jgi:Polyketide cyclase / dehydrase and lipid transport
MPIRVCPADRVEAPVEVVWGLLMNPATYGDFLDLTVDRVEPTGPAVAGQRFVGWTRALCRRWWVDGEVVEVDPAKHRIRFRMKLPLGIISNNHLSCVRTDAASCILRFG